MPADRRSYSGAESTADLAAYYRLKWSVAAGSILVAAVVSLLLVPLARYAGLALSIGAVCGIANMLAIMRGSERLVETRSPVFFGLSSLLRLAAFSIVAAALAARGPWWSLGPFLAGFFFPLAAYAWGALRVFRRKP
jgi:peptidoglycan biosynthesis protein MviN/MurJ (putative lipid II flippase)